MLISKIQLIDEDHILMRYQEREGETITTNNDKAKFKLYIFYCISEEKILRVFPKDSIELLYLMRNFCDNFRNVRSLQTKRPSSSHSNDVYCRAAFNRSVTNQPLHFNVFFSIFIIFSVQLILYRVDNLKRPYVLIQSYQLVRKVSPPHNIWIIVYLTMTIA